MKIKVFALILGVALVAAGQPVVAAEGAPTVVRLLTIDTDVRPGGTFTRTIHAEIQAVNNSAAASLAQQAFAFQETMQGLDIVEAYTLKADGRKIPVAANAIYIQQPQGDRTHPLFDDMRKKVAVFPNVAGGDSVIYTIRYTQLKPIIPGHYTETEFFQRTIAYDEVRETIRAPKDLPLYVETHELAFTKSNDNTTSTYSWHYSAPQPLPNDVLPQVSPLDHLPRFLVSSFKNYDEFAKTYLSLTADKGAVTPKIRDLAEKLTSGIADRRLQAQTLYEWVSKNIRYVAVEIGSGGIVPHNAEDVLGNAYGDCKDHVVLFDALLKAKGIASEMVLINLGNVYSVPDVATLNPMNHVITWLPEFGIYADTTAGVAPFGVLPFQEYGKPVIFAVASGRAVRKMPVLAPGVASVTMNTYARLDESGNVSGDTTVDTTGPYSLSLRALAQAIETAGAQRFAAAVLKDQGLVGSASFEMSSPTEFAPTYAMKSHFTFGPKMDWLNGGNFLMTRDLFMSEPAGAGLMGPTFDETSKESDATACFSGHQAEEISFEPPKGRRFVRLPADVHVKTVNLEFTAHWSMVGDVINVRREFTSTLSEPLCAGDLRRESAAALKTIRDHYTKTPISLSASAPVADSILNDLNAGLAAARSGDSAAAIQLYTKALSESAGSPSLLPLVYFSRANAYLAQQRYEQAIGDYSEAIKLNPGDARYFNNRSLAYKAMNDFDHALQDLAQAISISPRYTAAYNNRGLVYAAKNDYARAVKDYDEAILIDPNNSSAYNNRAAAKLKLRDTAGSKADSARAKELNSAGK